MNIEKKKKSLPTVSGMKIQLKFFKKRVHSLKASTVVVSDEKKLNEYFAFWTVGNYDWV